MPLIISTRKLEGLNQDFARKLPQFAVKLCLNLGALHLMQKGNWLILPEEAPAETNEANLTA